jgi:undecaprenyl-diphosphatase
MSQGERDAGAERREREREPWAGRLLRPLYAVLRWIDRHVRGLHAALGVFLLLGFVTLVAAVLAFAGIAALVQEGVTQRADEAILLWMNGHASPQLTEVALEVTSLGSTAMVWMTLAIASAFLWTARHHYSVLLLWVAMAGGTVINLTLKGIFARPRPHLFPWRTEMVGHSSFPSGHALTAVVLYATLAYLLARLGSTRALRRITLAVALLVILLIGLSRLYLGVHYPSDVLAGFIVGLGWSTFCALGIEAIRYFRQRKPGHPLQEEDLEEGTAPIRDAVEGHGGGG